MTHDERCEREHQWQLFNGGTGAIGYISTMGPAGAHYHPHRCICQGDDPTPHKHYQEDPHSCARCSRCDRYCAALPDCACADRALAKKDEEIVRLRRHVQTMTPTEAYETIYAALEHAEADVAALREVARAASHALRSYQYGNVSTDLAASVADSLDAALARTKEMLGHIRGVRLWSPPESELARTTRWWHETESER